MSSERTRSIRSLGGSARRPFAKLGWALEDRLLEAEQHRGVLGPAHRRWRDVTDHHHYWSAYDWSQQGEEWNASPEWKQALIDDVLLRWIPPGVATLEIGPGACRWTDVLVSRASHLTLVDVSERPLELCRQRFGENGHVSYTPYARQRVVRRCKQLSGCCAPLTGRLPCCGDRWYMARNSCRLSQRCAATCARAQRQVTERSERRSLPGLPGHRVGAISGSCKHSQIPRATRRTLMP